MKNTTGLLARWAAMVQSVNFIHVYRHEKFHGNADATTRSPISPSVATLTSDGKGRDDAAQVALERDADLNEALLTPLQRFLLVAAIVGLKNPQRPLAALPRQQTAPTTVPSAAAALARRAASLPHACQPPGPAFAAVILPLLWMLRL